MSVYTMRPAEDDGFWVVEGLQNPIIKRDVVVHKGPDQDFKELVYDLWKTYNRVVKELDVFTTPDGQFQMTGGMMVPYEPPPPPAPDTDQAQQDGQTAATPGQSAAPLPVVAVPVAAIDSKGTQFSGTLNLPWPNVTNSEIVTEWDRVSSALHPGNLITSIKYPGGSNGRILEIGYNNDTTKVVIEVG
jgi:hypothetical protein